MVSNTTAKYFNKNWQQVLDKYHFLFWCNIKWWYQIPLKFWNYDLIPEFIDRPLYPLVVALRVCLPVARSYQVVMRINGWTDKWILSVNLGCTRLRPDERFYVQYARLLRLPMAKGITVWWCYSLTLVYRGMAQVLNALGSQLIPAASAPRFSRSGVGLGWSSGNMKVKFCSRWQSRRKHSILTISFPIHLLLPVVQKQDLID